MTDRRALVRYPEFQAVGRQLGSGPTASMGQATTQRIKGVGLRWAADNAAAIMVLAALEPSGAWPSYGDACLQQAA